MIIKTLNKVPAEILCGDGLRGVSRQVPIGKAQGTPNFSFRVFTLAPKGHSPFHSHETEHVNYIISGRGALKDGKGVLHNFSAGDFCLVNPGEKHQYRNLSENKELIFICAVMKKYE
ncbi:MAG: cupin domain-containing protein [Fidelibacterota bacterium]